MSVDIELIPWGEMTARQQLEVEGGAGCVFEQFYQDPKRALFLAHWARVSAQAHGQTFTIDDLLDKLDFQSLMDMLVATPADQGMTVPPASAPTDDPPARGNGSATSPSSPEPSGLTPSPSSTPPQPF